MSTSHELHELHETAEHGLHLGMARVSFTMALLAMILAAVSVLGHRAHTEEVIISNKMANQWAFFQAKNIRRTEYELSLNLLNVSELKETEKLEKLKSNYEQTIERYKEEQKEIEAEARHMVTEGDTERRRANRFDLGEGFLEVSLVITSLTLMTNRKVFWAAGCLAGSIGVAIAATAFLIH